jgi:hypothetical protein
LSRAISIFGPISYIASLVNVIRYVMLGKVANKNTQTVASALIKQTKRLSNEL